MALTILDDSMSSDRSPHTARLASAPEHQWEVSWLPGRRLNRNQAITAMTLADATAAGDMHPGHRLWPHVGGWAAELGITASDALKRMASPPGRADGQATKPRPGSQYGYPSGRRRPEYVIVLAASDWVKERYPANRANLWDALHAGRDPHPGPEPDIPADPEAGE